MKTYFVMTELPDELCKTRDYENGIRYILHREIFADLVIAKRRIVVMANEEVDGMNEQIFRYATDYVKEADLGFTTEDGIHHRVVAKEESSWHDVKCELNVELTLVTVREA